MKRELKQFLWARTNKIKENCRAYPDEKVIETGFRPCSSYFFYQHCRAYPDEKGIETRS